MPLWWPITCYSQGCSSIFRACTEPDNKFHFSISCHRMEISTERVPPTHHSQWDPSLIQPLTLYCACPDKPPTVQSNSKWDRTEPRSRIAVLKTSKILNFGIEKKYNISNILGRVSDWVKWSEIQSYFDCCSSFSKASIPIKILFFISWRQSRVVASVIAWENSI